MKKVEVVTFCVLSLFVIALAGNAAAYNATFTHTNYMSSTEPTIDGHYAQGDEWVASKPENFGTNGVWRDEWTMGTAVYANLLIETSDATNDAGDSWIVCFDSTSAGAETPPNGGTAPQVDDYKLNVTGHGSTATVQWYKGTGTGWTPIASPSAATFAQAQSLSSSPKIGTQHYILEMHIEKTSTELGTVIMGYNWAQYVSYYDAHAGGNGLQSWPPASAAGNPDVPNSWGYIPYEMAANPTPDVPENVGIVVMLAVASVAIVSAVLIRKRHK